VLSAAVRVPVAPRVASVLVVAAVAVAVPAVVVAVPVVAVLYVPELFLSSSPPTSTL
jgi:hypothetical protein